MTTRARSPAAACAQRVRSSKTSCIGAEDRDDQLHERLSLLMQDVVSRVPALSFIDMADVLVFARSGRSNAEGAFATCHCLTLPASEPGYYFWRDRTTGRITRRSEWFVTKSPIVTIGARRSSTCSPSRCRASAISRSTARARRSSIRRADPWIREARYGRARAVSHRSGPRGHPPHRERGRHLFRQLPRPAFLRAGRGHGAHLSRQQPVAGRLRFPRDDFSALDSSSAASSAPASATSRRFRSATSSGWRTAAVRIGRGRREGRAAARRRSSRRATPEDDLHVRQFTKDASQRLIRKGQFRAASNLDLGFVIPNSYPFLILNSPSAGRR